MMGETMILGMGLDTVEAVGALTMWPFALFAFVCLATFWWAGRQRRPVAERAFRLTDASSMSVG